MTIVAGIESTRQASRMVAELTAGGVIKVLGMAEKTVIGQTAKDTAWMTITAVDESVRARQPKTRLIMEKGARQEGLLVVAFKTLWTKAAKVGVSMTIYTFGSAAGLTLLPLRSMALLAGQQIVCTTEPVRPEIMIL